MSALNIAVENPSADLTIWRLSGEFEGMSALDAKDKLLGCAKTQAKPNLMIDLAEVQYIDSAAIGILLEIARQLQAKKIKLSLIHVAEPIRKVLVITKVDKILTVHDV